MSLGPKTSWMEHSKIICWFHLLGKNVTVFGLLFKKPANEVVSIPALDAVNVRGRLETSRKEAEWEIWVIFARFLSCLCGSVEECVLHMLKVSGSNLSSKMNILFLSFLSAKIDSKMNTYQENPDSGWIKNTLFSWFMLDWTRQSWAYEAHILPLSYDGIKERRQKITCTYMYIWS